MLNILAFTFSPRIISSVEIGISDLKITQNSIFNAVLLMKNIMNLIEKSFLPLYRNYSFFTISSSILFFFIAFLYAPFERVFTFDSYQYLNKAFEITQGNWIPLQGHFIGWSVVLAFFLKILSVDTIFKGMVVSRLISIVCMSLTILPLAYLAKNLVGKQAGMLSVFAFSFSPYMIAYAGSGLTEPLFILLVVSSIYFLTKSHAYKNFAIATIFASLSYYVRPNGIFLLPVICLYLIDIKKDKKIQLLIFLIILFFLVSSPHLFTRYQIYGSAFDYGTNSNYLANSYAETAAIQSTSQSLLESLSHFNIDQYLDKFVFNGLFKALGMLPSLLIWVWLFPFVFGCIHYLINKTNKKINIIYIILFIFLGGYSIVFDVYGTSRHLLVLLPFIYIISSGFLLEGVIKKFKFATKKTIIIFILTILSAISVFYYQKIQANPVNLLTRFSFSEPQLRDEWAIWAVEHLKGNVAVIVGNDLITLASPNPLKQNLEISLINLPYFEDLEKGLEYMKKNKVDYLILSPENIYLRPYLKDVYDTEWSDNFILLQSFKSKPRDQWIIKDIDIFRVVY